MEDAEGSKTKFNMAEADLLVIDKARTNAHQLQLQFRYDASVGVTIVDLCRIMYKVINAVLDNEKDRNIHNKDIKRINELFVKCDFSSKKERKRALRRYGEKFVFTSPSDELYSEIDELLTLLYSLKQKLGMGLQKQVDVDFTSTWKRAAD